MKGKGSSTIANLMRFEVERHIPFEIEEVAYDFLVMDEKDSMYSMVFVAVQKGKIEFIKGFLEKLSLKPDSITTSSLAVLNTIELDGVTAGGWQDIMGIVRKSDMLGKKGETNIALFFERGSASVAITRDGMCTNLKPFIMDSIGTREDALEEIISYVREMQATVASGHFNRMIVAGDLSAVAAESFEELRSSLGLDVDHVNGLTAKLDKADISDILPTVGVCFSGLGLGTYTTNLLPHKAQYNISRIAPLTSKIALVLICVLVIGIVVTEAVKQKKYVDKIEAAFQANEPVVKELENRLMEIEKQKERITFLEDIRDTDFALEVLSELASVIPVDSWVTNLDYKSIELKDSKKQGGELILNGFADSSSALISLLEDSPYFEKVEFVGPIKKTREKEQFKLSARIVRPNSKPDDAGKE
jgi:Tfp pilus assembly protein PilN